MKKGMKKKEGNKQTNKKQQRNKNFFQRTQLL
jgi:hypothetical protein